MLTEFVAYFIFSQKHFSHLVRILTYSHIPESHPQANPPEANPQAKVTKINVLKQIEP